MNAFVLSCLISSGALLVVSEAQTSHASKSTGQNNASGQTHALESERSHAEQKVRPEVAQQEKELKLQAQSTLDSEAIAAVRETQNAIQAISSNNTQDALSALERATGKIQILLARKPSNALVPVDAEVDVVDTAPTDTTVILDIAKDASRAIDSKDYPTARVLLDSLRSEIRLKTYNLPLATYPDALKRAAQLLDQKKTTEASDVLLTALNTLVVVDRVTPIPLVLADAAIKNAQTDKNNNKKDEAITLVKLAKNQLQRAKDLGYSSMDPEYNTLASSISDLEKQLQGNGNTESMFAKLKDELASFMKKESGRARR